jgi:hypothetical protein
MTTTWKIASIVLLLVCFPALGRLLAVKTGEILFSPQLQVAQAQWKPKHEHTINALIQCESQGKNVKVLDSNGFYSYGILQYQSSTWNAWSVESGIKGSPMNREDAVEMADWAIDNGLVNHWTCARLLDLAKK